MLLNLFVKKCKKIDTELKILILTDLHYVYNSELRLIENLEYDICILLGDINIKELKEIKKYVKGSIYGILGNHDSFGILEEAGIINIHNKIIEIDGIKIIGFQGSSKYKKGEHPLYSQKESIDISKRMKAADILVSHDSPYQLYKKDDAHCGLKGITQYIYKNRIYLNIHGHQHINSEQSLKNGTTIMGVYRCGIVNIKTRECDIIF